jgi:hypothetical protein
MSYQTRFGKEFRVNTTTGSNQIQPAIAALPDGRFVVAWADFSASVPDTSGAAIRAQIYNADGTQSGSEFVGNTTVANDQKQPTVVALSDGRFVLAWQDGNNMVSDIRAQIFDGKGVQSSREFLVNTTLSGEQFQPAAAALQNGRFVVTWTDTSDGTFFFDVRGQVFNADGSKAGVEFVVNTTRDDDQLAPAIAALSDGRFVVIWEDQNGDGSGSAIRGQIFKADGTRSGSQFFVNSTTANGQFSPAIAALTNGGFVVSWEDSSAATPDSSGFAVRAAFFNASGTPTGNDFVVNTLTTADQVQPSIAALADGHVVIVWTDNSHQGGDTSLGSIAGQVFNADGTRDGPQFLINTTTFADQLDPAVTALSDGRYVVSWTDNSGTDGDSSGSQVRAQIFSLADTTAPTRITDVNADGVSDILFQNGGGQVAGWTVQNGGFQAYNNIGNAGGYTVVGSGDFNGSGTADILFQDASGNVADWIVQNGQFSSYNALGNSGTYKALAIGDLDGNGTSDVVFQDASGNVAAWLIENGRFSSYRNLGNAGGYKVVGAGDFNGDGTADILFQDAAGNVADWIVKNGAYSSYNALGNAGAYKAVGTGDVNADGTTDIVFQDPASGQVADWIVNSGKYQSYNNVGNAGGFSVVGTGDYNGDGTTDILFQNAGGQVANWTLSNGQFQAYNNVGNAAGYKAS